MNKILIIEDEKHVAELIASYLMQAGFYTTIAADGVEGLHKAIESQPDLITLDLMLPKMAGEEVCKAIRESKNPKVKDIPIIMITAKATHVDKVVGKVIGGNAYITKPFSPAEVVTEVKKQLKKSQERIKRS